MPRGSNLTHDLRVKGGKARQQLPDAKQHQEWAYYCLQIQKPGVAMWVYKQKVKPYMQAKQNGG